MKNNISNYDINIKRITKHAASLLLGTGIILVTHSNNVKATAENEEMPKIGQSNEVISKDAKSSLSKIVTNQAEETNFENNIDPLSRADTLSSTIKSEKEQDKKLHTDQYSNRAAQTISTTNELGIKDDWQKQVDDLKILSEELSGVLNELKNIKDADEWQIKYGEVKVYQEKLKENFKGISDIDFKYLGNEGTDLDHWMKTDQGTILRVTNELSQRNKELDELISKLDKLGLYDKQAQDPSNLKQGLILSNQNINSITTSVEVKDANGSVYNLTNNTYKTIFGDKRYVFDLEKSISTYKNSEFLTLNYTDNTEKLWAYDNKPIKNIVITFSNAEGNTGAGKIIFGADPTKGWWYDNMSGVTAKITFYDLNDKQITFGNDVYISVLSLNSYGPTKSHSEDFGYEGAELKSDGKSIRILESTVRPDVNNEKIIHADGNNSEDFPENFEYATWDSNEQTAKGIYGTGFFKVSGDSVILRSFKANRDGTPYNKKGTNNNVDKKSAWFLWTTNMPSLSINKKTIEVEWKDYFIPSAVVHYWENQQGATELDVSHILIGKPDEKINYSSKLILQKMIDQGYELVSNEYDENGAPVFLQNDAIQNYHIVLKKKDQNPDNTNAIDPVEPEEIKPSKPTTDDSIPTILIDVVDPKSAEKVNKDSKFVEIQDKTKQHQKQKQTEDKLTKAKLAKEKSITNKPSKANVANNTNASLPQTGEKNNRIFALINSIFIALGLTIFIGTKKRKNSK